MLFQRFFAQVEQVDAAVISLFMFSIVLTALDCRKDKNDLENRKNAFFAISSFQEMRMRHFFHFRSIRSRIDNFFGRHYKRLTLQTHFFRLAHFLPSFLPVLSSGCSFLLPPISALFPSPFFPLSIDATRASKKCVGAIRRLLPL